MRLIVTMCVTILFMPLVQADVAETKLENETLQINHQTFRQEVVRYVRDVAISNKDDETKTALTTLEKEWNNHSQQTHWRVHITSFHQGQEVGKGEASGASLTEALQQATKTSLNGKIIKSKTDLDDYYFKISFDYHPDHVYSMVNNEDKAYELQGDRVIIRHVDKERIKQQIKQSKAYLLRTINGDYAGVFKFYDAEHDSSEHLLRTTYSATTLNTLIRLNQFQKDIELQSYFDEMAQFLLDRQLTSGPNAGGFDYGVDPDTDKETCRIVVGTTSKTIFTLLLLHQMNPDEEKYLKSAQSAGDWLLKMVNDDGVVTPVAQCDNDKWTYNDKQSILYSGQVVSALSRLYATTHNADYLDGAKLVASQLVREVGLHGALVGDDYRPANSISSSWIMMALIDLAKVDPTPVYQKTILQIADMLVERQIDQPDDAYNHGRYLDAMTTSGNGWINEVMGEMVPFCEQQKLGDCDQYREAMHKTSRWLLQNTYNENNTYNISNPKQAMGGFINNFSSQKVRTDAVCHGVNGLLSMLENEPEGTEVFMDLPERPLAELLPLLRAGEYD
ncbi:hypothetical protein SAMN04488079_11017 [Methylophaga sulfidovorans]|uniref:Uncharacterized protein n=2 Tax=Methylophaga sulfidovorans TaxID=45496 RepID=A0A1I3Z7V9_9GAMM|nr:hypothetical protein SAMN04488079_11017 [Methylophaga sulfidovorans]